MAAPVCWGMLTVAVALSSAVGVDDLPVRAGDVGTASEGVVGVERTSAEVTGAGALATLGSAAVAATDATVARWVRAVEFDPDPDEPCGSIPSDLADGTGVGAVGVVDSSTDGGAPAVEVPVIVSASSVVTVPPAEDAVAAVDPATVVDAPVVVSALAASSVGSESVPVEETLDDRLGEASEADDDPAADGPDGVPSLDLASGLPADPAASEDAEPASAGVADAIPGPVAIAAAKPTAKATAENLKT